MTHALMGQGVEFAVADGTLKLFVWVGRSGWQPPEERHLDVSAKLIAFRDGASRILAESQAALFGEAPRWPAFHIRRNDRIDLALFNSSPFEVTACVAVKWTADPSVR